MNKQILFTAYLTLILSIYINAQDRFFLMTDDWKTTGIHEYDTHYMVIGSGSTGYPNYTHYINFNKIGKEGIISDIWQYPFEITKTNEARNQQSFSVLGNKKVLGITYVAQVFSGSLRKSARLVLNDEMTAIIDSNWVHSTNDDAIMYNTLQNKDKILSSLGVQDANNLDVARFRFIATDSTGTLLWQNNYMCSEPCWMFPQHIIPTQDGGYVLTSEELRNPPPVGPEHEVSTLIKTDSLGEFEWRIYPGGVGMPYTSNDILAVATDDGNILCAWTDRRKRREVGYSVSYQQNEEQTIWFAKIDLNGNKLWEKNISDEWSALSPVYTELFQMISLSDGNIAIATAGLVVKITQDAEVIWIRDVLPDLFHPPSAGEFTLVMLHGIIETSDSGFLCTGEAWINPGDAFPQWTQTGFVIKVDEHGCLEEGCQLVDVEEVVEEENNTLLIYPNPASIYLNIRYDLSQHESLSLQVVDVTGKVVHQRQLNQSQDEIVLITENYPTGQYILSIYADNQLIESKKFNITK